MLSVISGNNVRACRPSVGQIHYAATRTSLLRRNMFPTSAAWMDFFPRAKRDWHDVSVNDIKTILDKPHKYAPIPGTVHDVLRRDVRFQNPSGKFYKRHHAAVAVNLAYGTLINSTGGVTSLATSSTWLAGYELFLVDNTAAVQAGLQLDWYISGQTMVGTTPTATTEIRYYLVGSPDGTFWPDVFDGTPSAETVTSAGVFTGFGKLACISQVGATTSNVAYPYAFGVRQWFDNLLPKKFVVFVTHNTGVNLNATAGNHSYYAQPEYVTAT